MRAKRYGGAKNQGGGKCVRAKMSGRGGVPERLFNQTQIFSILIKI